MRVTFIFRLNCLWMDTDNHCNLIQYTHAPTISDPVHSTASIQGCHSWLQPSVSCIHESLAHYFDCKSRDPYHISALIALPRWYRRKSWHKLLNHMICISFLSKSSDNLYASVVSQGHALTALPWSYDLWYDPPKTQMKLNMTELQTNSLASIMMGDISHSHTKVLFASGATHNFIASSLVQHLKLQVHASPGSISCGGNATVSSLGYCYAPINIGTYHEKVRFNVMPMAMTSFQVVLGQAWLATHDANIDYLQSHISFWHQSKQHVLVFGSATSDPACLPALEFRKLASEANSLICHDCIWSWISCFCRHSKFHGKANSQRLRRCLLRDPSRHSPRERNRPHNQYRY